MARDVFAWALSTFHTTILVAVLVLLVHLSGGFGDLLSGLNTLLGLALFALLWFLVWWATRNVLGAVALPSVVEWSVTKAVLLRGSIWGATVGALFFWGIVAITVFPRLLAPNAIIEPVNVLFIALIGSAIALPVGGLIGLLFAIIDVGIVQVANRLGG